jgi:hypothetical protein
MQFPRLDTEPSPLTLVRVRFDFSGSIMQLYSNRGLPIIMFIKNSIDFLTLTSNASLPSIRRDGSLNLPLRHSLNPTSFCTRFAVNTE